MNNGGTIYVKEDIYLRSLVPHSENSQIGNSNHYWKRSYIEDITTTNHSSIDTTISNLETKTSSFSGDSDKIQMGDGKYIRFNDNSSIEEKSGGSLNITSEKHIVFRNSRDNTTYNEFMRISDNGNVGIGISSLEHH